MCKHENTGVLITCIYLIFFEIAKNVTLCLPLNYKPFAYSYKYVIYKRLS